MILLPTGNHYPIHRRRIAMDKLLPSIIKQYNMWCNELLTSENSNWLNELPELELFNKFLES